MTSFPSCADTIRLNYRLVKETDLNLETTQKKKKTGGNLRENSCLMIVEHFKPILPLEPLYHQTTALIRTASEVFKATQ